MRDAERMQRSQTVVSADRGILTAFHFAKYHDLEMRRSVFVQATMERRCT